MGSYIEDFFDHLKKPGKMHKKLKKRTKKKGECSTHLPKGSKAYST